MKENEKKTEKFVELDSNLLVETEFPDATDAVFHDVRKRPFDLYNFYQPKKSFIRYPKSVMEEAGSPKAERMSRESTGGKIRFCTDSKYILLRAEYISVGRISHAPLAMTAGFDLYEDGDFSSRYIRTFMPPYNMKDSYMQIIRFPSRKMRYFTVNFPVRSIVSKVEIGLQADSALGHGKKYPNEDKPIVVYGSSIVHGTAASRPGQTYPNMLSRALGMYVMNMGLSGSAKAEIPVMEYLASIPMSLFVYDYDHNAPTAEYLKETHKRGFDIIRAKNPTLPIIMISKPNISTAFEDMEDEAQERKAVIFETYRAAKDSGDDNVYFIDGESFFRGKHENECSMDGAHPNDLGFMYMSDGIESVIRKILK